MTLGRRKLPPRATAQLGGGAGRPCYAPPRSRHLNGVYSHRYGRCMGCQPTHGGCWSHSDMALLSTTPQPLPDFTAPSPQRQQVLPPTLPSQCAAGQRTIDTTVTHCRLGFPPQTGSSRASAGHTRKGEACRAASRTRVRRPCSRLGLSGAQIQ